MIALSVLCLLPGTASAATSTIWVGPDVFPAGPVPEGPDGEGAIEEHETGTESPPRDTPFVLPLLAWDAVTDRFGAPRGGDLVHGGIDLALDSFPGSPVLSSCAGSIAVIAESSGYGNYIVVDCGAGWTTLYGHLSATLVEAGDRVQPGGLIGVSGNTGFSTGEHLHFEIRFEGVTRNPEDYLDFNIPEGAPLSSGPILLPSPSPSPTESSTADGTETETATATPDGTETPAPEVVTLETLVREGESASAPMILRVANQTAKADSSQFVLVVNHLGEGAAAAASVVVADAACDGCRSVAVLVHVNLHKGEVAASKESSIQAVVTRCGKGCGALAFAMEIDVSLKGLETSQVEAFTAALEALLLPVSESPETLALPALREALENLVAAFPDFAGHARITVKQAPDGAFDELPQEPSPTASPSGTGTPTAMSGATGTPSATATPSSTAKP